MNYNPAIANEVKRVGRLAFRVEGDKWSCYYAMSDTMAGAIWMGTIAMAIVQNPARKAAFIVLMRSALEEFLQERGFPAVESWNTERAPESERSGSA